MNRRGFLHGILAVGAAPAIVRIGSLMPVRSIEVATTAEVLAFNESGTHIQVEEITRRINEIAAALRAHGLIA